MEEMIKYVCTLVIIEYYGIILMNGGGGGSMFVGSKNCSGSWIHNFIGSKFKII